MVEPLVFMPLIFMALMVLILSLSLGLRINVLERRLAMMTRIDGKLDELMKHAGVVYDPYLNVPQAVEDAVKSGKKIQAIKCYRAETGVGLMEAKDFVEELIKRAGIAPSI